MRLYSGVLYVYTKPSSPSARRPTQHAEVAPQKGLEGLDESSNQMNGGSKTSIVAYTSLQRAPPLSFPDLGPFGEQRRAEQRRAASSA